MGVPPRGRRAALSARITGYLILGAIVAALLFWTFHTIDGWLGARDALITEQSQAQLALHPALVRLRGRLRAAEVQHAAAARQHRQDADSLRLIAMLLDSLSSHQPVDTVKVDDRARAWHAVAEAEHQSASECFVSLTTCQERANSAQQEADSLAARLEAQLSVRPKRCWLSTGGGYGTGSDHVQAIVAITCGLVRIPVLP